MFKNFKYPLAVLGIISLSAYSANNPSNNLADNVQLPQAGISNQYAVEFATKRLIQEHYHKFKLDDEFSLRILNRYLDNLDYTHSTFLQSDVDNIRQKYGKVIDDDLRSGNLKNAFAIYDLYVKRRVERLQYLISLLNKEPDLSVKDQIEVKRDKAPWPKNIQEMNTLWQERFKNDVINQKLKNKSWEEIKAKLTKRYQVAIKNISKNTAEDVTQTYLNSFTREIDPHTSYLAPKAADSFNDSMNLSMEGIGAGLRLDDDETVIRSLITGGPAKRSKKLKVGDKIIGVGQSRNQIEDVVGWRLSDVVDKIKGKKGTRVYLEIEPEKGGKSQIISLVRDTIRLEDQAAKLTVKTIDNHKIGVIKIQSFYLNLANDVRKLLQDVAKDHVESLVIDLRFNGGGSLKEVIELAGLFIKGGAVVQVRDALGNVKIYEDNDEKYHCDLPLLVMINRYSASASEIFAAAMQDYNRAIILGTNTYGKGTVQQSRTLGEYDDEKNKKEVQLGFLQHTIQKFYRINGDSTQIKGVQADITFPAIVDMNEYGEGHEDNALPWDRITSAFYTTLPSKAPYLAELREKHAQRMAKNPEFIVLNENLAEIKRLNERKYLSLQYKERKAENDKFDAKQLRDLNARFQREGKKPLKKLDDLPKDYEEPDFYLDEAQLIAVDYLKALQPKLANPNAITSAQPAP